MTDEQILAHLRHMYHQLVENVVVNQRAFADGSVSILIRELERRIQQKNP